MAPDPLICVRELSKHFRTFHRREGIWGGIQNLFVRDYQTVQAVDRLIVRFKSEHRGFPTIAEMMNVEFL